MTEFSNPQKAVDEKVAAKYIGMSVPFLRQSRMEDALETRTPGPPYLKVGRAVRYLLEDLDAWLAAHRVEQAKERVIRQEGL